MKFIPLERTIGKFQDMLKMSALTGTIFNTPAEIIGQLKQGPIYDVDYVVREVTAALVAENPKTNCLAPNGTEYVIVTREKLEQVLDIIKNGGMKEDDDE